MSKDIGLRDINKFMNDIGEYEVSNIEVVEEDEYDNPLALKIKMVNPMTEQKAELYVDAWYKRESNYDMYPRNPKVPAIEYGRKEWYEVVYRPDKQEADQDAVMRLYKLIYEDKVNLGEILDKPYQLKVYER